MRGNMEKTVACATALSQKGIKKKRGRKEIIISEREAVTAYRRLSVYRISGTFEQPMTQIRTICNNFMNAQCLRCQCVTYPVSHRQCVTCARMETALCILENSRVPPLSIRYQSIL